MSDRIQYDADELDEIVLTNVTLHLERMSHHGWYLGGYRDGEHLSVWFEASQEPVVDEGDWKELEHTHHGPLTYACPVRWDGHRCEVEKKNHRVHKCECGASV